MPIFSWKTSRKGKAPQSNLEFPAEARPTKSKMPPESAMTPPGGKTRGVERPRREFARCFLNKLMIPRQLVIEGAYAATPFLGVFDQNRAGLWHSLSFVDGAGSDRSPYELEFKQSAWA